MDKLELKYITFDKSTAPQAIRMKIPGWSGVGDKMEDGSEPQPWHCLPFTEGATYGLELVYPYETECHVVNEDGKIRFDWDFSREPQSRLTGGEFVTFFPKEASHFYLFNTGVDLAPPAGYVVRTEPHPRFFTDRTGTAPVAVVGHVQGEWWPKKFFVVFKAPLPGERQIFRRGEPYVQLLLVPQRLSLETAPMSPQENERRRALEQKIALSNHHIATNVWQNPSGYAFSNHYKILARAFSREGQAGVEVAAAEGFAIHQVSIPRDQPISECLARGYQLLKAEKYREARVIYTHVLEREPDNAEALARLGVVAACLDVPMVGLKLMRRAIELEPRSALYRTNLGEVFRRVGQFDEAEKEFRAALQLMPNDPYVSSNLGLTLAQVGRTAEGVQLCRAALAAAPQLPAAHYRMGAILALQGQTEGARAFYQAALSLDPGFAEAQRGLEELIGH
jgi:tetratricopeptide (TPR) repeat protein